MGHTKGQTQSKAEVKTPWEQQLQKPAGHTAGDLSAENPGGGGCSSQPHSSCLPTGAPFYAPAPHGGKKRHHQGPSAPKGVADLPSTWDQGRTGERNILRLVPFWLSYCSHFHLSLSWQYTACARASLQGGKKKKKSTKKCFPQQHVRAGRWNNILFICTASLEASLLVQQCRDPRGRQSIFLQRANTLIHTFLPVFLPSYTGLQHFFTRPQIKKRHTNKMQILLIWWHHNKNDLLIKRHPDHTEQDSCAFLCSYSCPSATSL